MFNLINALEGRNCYYIFLLIEWKMKTQMNNTYYFDWCIIYNITSLFN